MRKYNTYLKDVFTAFSAQMKFYANHGHIAAADSFRLHGLLQQTHPPSTEMTVTSERIECPLLLNPIYFVNKA